jgi:hypothetical protein
MARKSAAALAVATPLNPRPEPPHELTDEEREVWRAVVATKPADWFTRDTHPLLVQYCRMTLRARQLAQMHERLVDIENPADAVRSFDALVKLEATVSGVLATLATKMRLSQQSKYGARGAEGVARRGGEGSGAKPWEFGKSGG